MRAGVLCLFVGLLLWNDVWASRQKITSLPGLANMPSYDQWAGYINVNKTLGKEYYYWFVESQNDPSSDPLLLWMQGGPGCSGLLGFWQENGPFRIQPDGSLTENPFSWNQNANVIYLEQPAGVGFSYSMNEAGYSTNDNQTAVDNYDFLLGWFNEFPEYQTNEFWLTGESYAGVYIPTLANQILEGPDDRLLHQFQGFMLGNPVIHCPAWIKESSTVIVNNWYWHGLISYSNRVTWYQENCHVEYTSECEELFSQFEHNIGPYTGDELFMNFCTGNGTLDFVEEISGCRSLGVMTGWYLNRPEVRAAIYANPPPEHLVWSECTSHIHYSQLGLDMIDFYNKFFDNTAWRILVYSGDLDISTCPHPYSQLCLSSLNRPVVSPWARWTVPGPTIPSKDQPSPKNNITAGYQEIYDTYTFATVRGAGHEVPTFQPLFAKEMLERFIINKANL